MRKIMLCLLLFSLLIMAHARGDAAQEMDVDLALAFEGSPQTPTMDQYALLDLPTLNLFDVVVAEATQEFDRVAALKAEPWFVSDDGQPVGKCSDQIKASSEEKTGYSIGIYVDNKDFGKSAKGMFDTTCFKSPPQAGLPRVYA